MPCITRGSELLPPTRSGVLYSSFAFYNASFAVILRHHVWNEIKLRFGWAKWGQKLSDHSPRASPGQCSSCTTKVLRLSTGSGWRSRCALLSAFYTLIEGRNCQLWNTPLTSLGHFLPTRNLLQKASDDLLVKNGIGVKLKLDDVGDCWYWTVFPKGCPCVRPFGTRRDEPYRISSVYLPCDCPPSIDLFFL